jgi:hypothetical protein
VPLLTLSPQKQKEKTQEALVAWLVEEGATASEALIALLVGLLSEGGAVMVETEPGKTRQFPFEQIQKANLKFEW